MNIKSFLSKGVANIISGFSGSLLSLVTVPIITKSLLNDELSIWFICLQISGFMMMLSFGAKLIFTRHVSQYPENKKRINKILSTCRTILNRMCILGSIATILIVIFLPYLYEIPKEILLQARFSLLIITSAMILMSWVSDLHGVLWGSNKNEKSALIILATRFLQIIAIYVCSKISPSLEFFSIAYSLPIILSSLFLVFYIRRKYVIFDKFKYTKTLTQDNNVKSEMYTLGLWSVATMLVQGIDVIVVSFYSFSDVPSYSIASTIIFFFLGLINGLFSPLIQWVARKSINDANAPKNFILKINKYYIPFLGVVFLIIYFTSEYFINLWVGSNYHNAILFLKILSAGLLIRSIFLPLSFIIISQGEQNKIKSSPMLEALLNLFFSIILGYKFGAIGVALGTLISSVLITLAMIFYYCSHLDFIKKHTSKVKLSYLYNIIYVVIIILLVIIIG